MNKNQIYLIMALALFGYLLWFVLFIIPFPVFDETPLIKNESGEPLRLFFNHRPNYYLWIFLNGLQSATWFAFLVPFFIWMKRISREYQKIEKKFWLLVVSVLVMLTIVLGMQTQFFSNYAFLPVASKYGEQIDLFGYNVFPFKNGALKLGIITTIGFIFAAIYIAGLLLTNEFINQLVKKEHQPDTLLKKFFELKQYSSFNLYIVSLSIAATTIATSVLASGINQEYRFLSKQTDDIYPYQIVLTHGLFFTMLIAIIYTPIFFRLMELGSRIKSEILNNAIQSENSLITQQENQSKLNEMLGIGPKFPDNIKIILSVLSPLLGSLLPKLFGIN